MSKGIKRRFIIPIFIPHQGCPHRCVFCQQSTITNVSEQLRTPHDIKAAIESAIRSKRFSSHRPKEIAFYGGTFTALPTSSMKGMLNAVMPFMKQGVIGAIRLSTRPDTIDEKVLDILQSYGVATVELGVQSMDDKVLTLSNRGHTASDTVNAVRLLKKRGFTVGVQLMPGLPGDSSEVFMDTIGKVVDLKPHMARLYPALVLKGTKLAQWYQQGKYTPMGLDETVSVCKDACMRLEASGIPVIRIGLMSSPSLLNEGEIIAGPWHPSLGFLVRSAMHIDRVRPYLPAPGETKAITLRAPRREIPLLKGYKNSGLKHLESITGATIDNILPDDSIAPCQVAFDTR
ncbi:MAG: radical SAM protein [Deltaproteobacteria bacterium]|nr:MAG: radical SAM protein [Deltaproteobacteria bacterium]